MAKRILGIIIFILPPILLICLYYFFYQSSGDKWSIQCQFHELTGWFCPGCGGQRAFDAILHGEFQKAIEFNILTYILVPFLAYCYIILGCYFFIGYKNITDKLPLKPWIGFVFLALLIIFFIIRNIPYYPFCNLSPS